MVNRLVPVLTKVPSVAPWTVIWPYMGAYTVAVPVASPFFINWSISRLGSPRMLSL